MIFTEEHINRMSWEEYGQAVDRMIARIEKNGCTFDAVAPVLRSGAIPGSMVAIRLRVGKIIPVQFKYMHQGLEQIIHPIPQCAGYKRLDRILICENNCSSGRTAIASIKFLKESFPKAELHYASVAMVFGGPELFEGCSGHYYGIRTNELFLASSAQENQLSLRPGICLFPWEICDDELNEMNNPINELDT